jgi:hypothetical protein
MIHFPLIDMRESQLILKKSAYGKNQIQEKQITIQHY